MAARNITCRVCHCGNIDRVDNHSQYTNSNGKFTHCIHVFIFLSFQKLSGELNFYYHGSTT